MFSKMENLENGHILWKSHVGMDGFTLRPSDVSVPSGRSGDGSEVRISETGALSTIWQLT